MGTLVVYCSLLLSAAPTSGPAERLESFAALFDEWQQSVRFKCRFERRLIRCSSLEAALAGEGERIEDELFPEGADGWLYKLETKVRYGVDYHAPPRELSPVDGPDLPFKTQAIAVTNVSFDEVGDGRLEVRFEPKRGNYGNAVWVAARPEDRGGLACAGVRSSTWINPLCPLDSGVANLFRFNPPGSLQATTPDDATVRALGDDRVEVSMSNVFAAPAAVRELRRLVVWTKPSLPVIEEIDDTIELPDARKLERHVLLRDFRECGGGMVARLVRYIAQGPVRDGQPSFNVLEWRSNDLGNEEPTDEDFVIELGQETAIIGLRKPLKRGEVHRLNIDEIKLSDLDLSGR
jgi:hypothetical protein